MTTFQSIKGVAVLGTALIAWAGAPARAADEVAAPVAVDPAAIDAVKAMGAYLRGLASFELEASLAYDEVVGEDTMVQRNEAVVIAARKPDRLYIEINGAERRREIYYDGAQVTIFGPLVGYYAQFDAPPTTAATIEKATGEYDMEIPLADLFFWGTDASDIEAIERAAFVGPARIGDRVCDQYAFTQEDVDWQLWIAQGDVKTPCKLVITDTTQETRPQYSAIIEIVPEKVLADDVFKFEPPHTAHKVAIAPAQPNE